MSKQRGRPGVSKAQWLEAGLKTLSEGGIAALTVEGLAKQLGISKAGFYWHFKNRDDLLRQLLDYWTHELTVVVTSNPELLSMAPEQRLVKAAKMISDFRLAKYELAVRHWALQDAQAAEAVKEVNKIRMDFVGTAFAELGFKGEDLEIRRMLFVAYHTWEPWTFQDIPHKRLRAQISKRIGILTKK